MYYGLSESNGNFSALENPDKKSSSLSVLLIDGGKVDKKNLALCGIEQDELNKFLEAQGAKIKSVLVMTVNGDGRVYFQKRGEKYKILKMETGHKW